MNTTDHTPRETTRPPGVNLYMRTDGSLMVAQGDSAIEIRLTVDQLLMLGMDCLSVAVKINPHCAEAVVHALASTKVLVPVDAARQDAQTPNREGQSCLH